MMDLRNFFGRDTQAGGTASLWAKFGFFFEVGGGRLAALDSRFVHFVGGIDTHFHRGPVSLMLRLTREGTCSVSVNGVSDHHATYSVQGESLLIHALLGDELQQISLTQVGGDGSETCVSILGSHPLELVLAPAVTVAMAA